MNIKNEQIEFILYQLNNVLRGDALRAMENKTISAEEKKKKLQAIEEMKNYLDNFEKNTEFLKAYNERIIDDDLR